MVFKFDKSIEAFNKIKRYVSNLNLQSSSAWAEYCKSSDKPGWIPSKINEVYKDYWKGWDDFLGKNKK